MGTLSIDQRKIVPNSDGSYSRRDVILAFGSSYNNTGNDATTGETLRAYDVNLNRILAVEIAEDAGYGFEALGIDEVDPKTECRIKVYEGAGGTTSSDSAGTPAGTVTATALAAETFTITDDVNASTYSRAGIVSVPDVGYQFSACAEVWPDTSAPGPLAPVDTSLGNKFLVSPLGFDNQRINVTNNGAPMGNNVYFKPTGFIGPNADIVGILVSNIGAGSSSHFSLVDPATGLVQGENVSVFHSSTPTNLSFEITVDNTAPNGSRITVVMPDGGYNRCYVQSQKGRYIAFNVWTAALVAPLTFDATIVDETLRLESTAPTFGNTFSPQLALLRLFNQVPGRLFAVVSGGTVTLEAEVNWFQGMFLPDTVVNVRIGERVLPVTIVQASAGVPVYFDSAIKFAANFGTGNKTVDLSLSDKPEGYQPTYSFGGVALAGHTHTVSASAGTEVPNGTDLSTVLGVVKATIYGY